MRKGSFMIQNYYITEPPNIVKRVIRTMVHLQGYFLHGKSRILVGHAWRLRISKFPIRD